MDIESNKRSQKRESERSGEMRSKTEKVAREHDATCELDDTDVLEKVDTSRSISEDHEGESLTSNVEQRQEDKPWTSEETNELEDELLASEEDRAQEDESQTSEEAHEREDELLTSEGSRVSENESQTSEEASARENEPQIFEEAGAQEDESRTSDEESSLVVAYQEHSIEEKEDMPSSDGKESAPSEEEMEQVEESALISQPDEVKTREARRKKRTPKQRLRLIPIWLRILIAILLTGGCFILGLMFGFGVIGNQDPAEVIRPETWYHIIDIIRGDN